MSAPSGRASGLRGPDGAAIAELVHPRPGSAGDDGTRAREIRGAFDTTEEDRGAQLELECREPLEARLLALERRLQQRTAHADRGRAQRERLRGVEPAPHAAGRDDRQTRGRGAEDRDRGGQTPIAEALTEAHAERVAPLARAQALDRRE